MVMSYYMQLVKKFKLLDYMQAFQKDLTFHGKKELAKATAFIAGARPTGFNTIIYDDIISDCVEKRAVDYSQCEEYDKPSPLGALESNNERFFVGYEGSVEEITKEQALKIYNKWVAEAKAKPEYTATDKKGLYWIVRRELRQAIRDFMIELQELPSTLLSEMGMYSINPEFEEKEAQIYADIIKLYLKKKFKRGVKSSYAPREQREILRDIKEPEKLLIDCIHFIIDEIKRKGLKYFESE